MQQDCDLHLVEAVLEKVQLTRNQDGPLCQARTVHARTDVLQIQQLVEGTDDGITKRRMLLLQLLDAELKFRHFESEICDCSQCRRLALSATPGMPGPPDM